MKGQRVIVVGGTSGMGRATARAAAARGAEAIAAGRRPVAEREPAAGVRDVVADVTDPGSVRALFDAPVDHVLVTASPGRAGPLLEQEPEQARSFLDGKLFGAWLVARYAAPRLRAGGSLTYVTGAAVVRPPGDAATVVAAFAGVEGLTRALALELGPIRVNAIRPGYTDSEMWSGLDAGRARRPARAGRGRDAGAPDGRAGGHRRRRAVPDGQPAGHRGDPRGQRRRDAGGRAVIVVTGAGGNVGGELAAQLAAAGEPVRAIVRDPARAALPDGVEVVAGDLELPESLTPALAGARAVFLLGGWSDMPGIVRRIGGAGAERVVLLTSRCVIGGRPDNAITGMWLDAEAAVRAGAVPWTIVRPSGFQSNALRWRPQLAAGDVVRAPWPGVRIAAIDPADIAAVAAVALTAERPRGRRARAERARGAHAGGPGRATGRGARAAAALRAAHGRRGARGAGRLARRRRPVPLLQRGRVRRRQGRRDGAGRHRARPGPVRGLGAGARRRLLTAPGRSRPGAAVLTPARDRAGPPSPARGRCRARAPARGRAPRRRSRPARRA